MNKIFSFFNTIKSLLYFSYPIILGQLGQMLIGAGDVFVAGRHGTLTIAAIGIANAIMTTILIAGLGLLQSISPVLAKKRGENIEIEKYLNISLIYAMILAVIFLVISLITVSMIPYLGFDGNVVPYVQDYIKICSFSFLGAYLYQALKEFLQAYEHVFFANFVSIVAIFLNLFLAWILVFGFWIIPSIGVKGLAIASLIVRTSMGLALLFYCKKYFQNKLYIEKQYIKDLLLVGYPMMIALLLELSAYSLTTLIIGKISNVQVATHNIVLTLSSITFMVPLAISNAVGVRVGYAYGAEAYQDIKESIIAGFSLSLLIMSGFAFIFLLIPQVLIGFFSSVKDVVITGSKLLLIVALFQIFDGTQITLSGALRGLGSTRSISLTMLIGYWFVGIPLGVYLAFKQNLQIYGLWIGLAFALFSCAVVFALILLRKLRKIRLALS